MSLTYRAWEIEGVATKRVTAAVADLNASALSEQLSVGTKFSLDGDALNQVAVIASANQLALHTLSLTDLQFTQEVQHFLRLAHEVRDANKAALGNKAMAETPPSIH